MRRASAALNAGRLAEEAAETLSRAADQAAARAADAANAAKIAGGALRHATATAKARFDSAEAAYTAAAGDAGAPASAFANPLLADETSSAVAGLPAAALAAAQAAEAVSEIARSRADKARPFASQEPGSPPFGTSPAVWRRKGPGAQRAELEADFAESQSAPSDGKAPGSTCWRVPGAQPRFSPAAAQTRRAQPPSAALRAWPARSRQPRRASISRICPRTRASGKTLEAEYGFAPPYRVVQEGHTAGYKVHVGDLPLWPPRALTEWARKALAAQGGAVPSDINSCMGKSDRKGTAQLLLTFASSEEAQNAQFVLNKVVIRSAHPEPDRTSNAAYWLPATYDPWSNDPRWHDVHIAAQR